MARVPFHIFLDPDLMESLKRLQVKTGAPIGELIRRGVRAYLIQSGELKSEARKPAPAKARRVRR